MMKAYFVATTTDVNVVVMATNEQSAVNKATKSLLKEGIDWIDELRPVAYELSEFLDDEDDNAIVLNSLA